MSPTIPVENRAGLSAEAFAPLEAALREQSSMRRAMAWWFAHQPPLSPAGMITQDEFSYDLLIPHPGGLVLSYATS
ncbi:MAG: hypothetical protein ACRC33_29615 [Gemmataceae bacterium]